MSIIDRDGNPVSTTKPEPLAETVAKANEILQEAQDEATPEREMTPVEQFVMKFYDTLTPQLKAILSAGIGVDARLTQSPDGTLSLEVRPAEQITRIDEKTKTVYRAPVSPAPEIVNAPEGADGGDCCEAKSPCCQSGVGEDPGVEGPAGEKEF